MKNINFIFSVIFLLWCFLVLIVANNGSYYTAKTFAHGLNDVLFNFFWEFIIFTTFFNIFARIFNQSNFYLVGAFGLAVLCIGQLVYVMFYIKTTISKNFYGHINYTQPNIILTSLPYALFGIISSTCCYCNAIREKLDRNRTKFQLFLIRFSPTDPQKIILFFNISASISFLMLFILLLLEQKFVVSTLILLIPSIPCIFNILAVYKKERKYYLGTGITWAMFGCGLVLLLIKYIINFLSSGRKKYQVQPNIYDLLHYVTLISIILINSFIGIFSSISVYRKGRRIQRNDEYILDDPNAVVTIEYKNVTEPSDSELEIHFP